MSCECCEREAEPRTRDYYEGLSDGLRYAATSLESVYGHKDEDLPSPVIVVLSYLGELHEVLESQRLHRLMREVGAKVPTMQDVRTIKIEGRE